MYHTRAGGLKTTRGIREKKKEMKDKEEEDDVEEDLSVLTQIVTFLSL